MIEKVRVDKNHLHFSVKAPKSGESMYSLCRRCLLEECCFGEINFLNNTKNANVNLNAPLVRNLTSDQNVPCGAGIEIINRSPRV
ncbi:MAG: hypothetical protein NTY75_03060 [Candidatus Shapirobacteria bacterium]|nr:hypothetical protein [Candidatus Shapirobacteria bacterium]